MKNIYDILKEFGLEVSEEKKADFDKAWKENYRTKADYDKIAGQRDEYKSSLDTVNAKLKEFDGVDVAELKGRIETLQGDLKKKDDEYAAREAERAFNDSLDKAITAAGGRNPKAIRGLLDLKTLRGSKDQTEDIKKALEAVKESDSYLFGSDEPFLNPVGPTNNKGGNGGNMGSLASIRAAMGLPAEKKGE